MVMGWPESLLDRVFMRWHGGGGIFGTCDAAGDEAAWLGAGTSACVCDRSHGPTPHPLCKASISYGMMLRTDITRGHG